MTEGGIWTNLLSGLAGSVLTIIASEGIRHLYRQSERKRLFRAIVSECRYNILILDDVANGAMDKHIPFKRMSVEFFKTIRQQSVAYALPKVVLKELSHVIIDLELLNRQADFAFKENQNKNSPGADITENVKAARLGVKGSLVKVLEIAQDELGEEDDEED